jgi:hypothetical protein
MEVVMGFLNPGGVRRREPKRNRSEDDINSAIQ